MAARPVAVPGDRARASCRRRSTSPSWERRGIDFDVGLPPRDQPTDVTLNLRGIVSPTLRRNNFTDVTGSDVPAIGPARSWAIRSGRVSLSANARIWHLQLRLRGRWYIGKQSTRHRLRDLASLPGSPGDEGRTPSRRSTIRTSSTHDFRLEREVEQAVPLLRGRRQCVRPPAAARPARHRGRQSLQPGRPLLLCRRGSRNSKPSRLQTLGAAFGRPLFLGAGPAPPLV